MKYPLGFLIPDDQITDTKLRNIMREKIMITTVGDATTDRVFMAGITPDVQIVDGKSMRKVRPFPGGSYEAEKKVVNDPGMISEQAMSVMVECYRGDRSTRIIVDGEEDLLALPAINLSPIGAIVLYGQPKEGIVMVEVNSKVKRKVQAILKEMKRVVN